MIGSDEFPSTFADTEAARAFAGRLPLTLDMGDVNSNEKAFTLPDALPSEPRSPGSISAGDLMLYGDSTVVLFYESFDTSYSYTRLGSIDDPEGLLERLGAGDVTVSFNP